MIINEDTGEAPECPFCGQQLGEEGDCTHVLAEIDQTFGECEGGALYGSVWGFQQGISAAMFEWLKTGATPHWGDYPNLQYIWEDALALWRDGSIPTADDVPVFDYGFWSTLEALLEDSGAVSAPGPLAFDSGMPGTSSAYSIIYAKDPTATLKLAANLLREYLACRERLPTSSSLSHS